MFFPTYTIEIQRAAACKPGYQPLFCTATLAKDISEVFPFLNAELKAIGFTRQPPSMMLRMDNRQIALEAKTITISDVRDAEEAGQILQELKNKIDAVWQGRASIKPSYGSAATPKVMDILALLPKTNCGDCGESTCTVFATLLMRGEGHPDMCPDLTPEKREQLHSYMKQFSLIQD